MILDEPTAFLDLPGRVDVMSLLAVAWRVARRHCEERSLLSTHDLDLALRKADRVWLLNRRGDLRSGKPRDLLQEGAFEIAFESEELSQYLPRDSGKQVGEQVAQSSRKTIGSLHHE